MTNRRHAHNWSIDARLLPVVAVALVLSGCVQYTTAPAAPRLPSTLTPLPSPLPPASGASVPQAGGWLLLSMEEFGNAHLFIFDIASARFSRITWGDWNDIEPSISPDGSSVAFASDRAGAWDLYTLDLASGSVTQLTNSPEYDGSPVWSPDMAWMAYDTLNDGQLDIAIQSLTDRSAAPVLLTDDPASDHSPSWSPDGRKIAFVSNRLGNEDIWLADLDKASDRFSNVTQSPRTAENHPAWSRDGSHLAWAAAVQNPGYPGIYIWDASRPDAPASWVGTGTWPVWSPDGSRITTVIDAPTNQLLGAFDLRGTPVSLPTSLSGRVRGLIWPAVSLPDPLPAPYLDAAQQVAPAASVATSTPLPDVPSQRWHIVPLEDVQAPSAGLHALAEPSFRELRARLIAEAGWDPLASLENTFVPITTTLDPGLDQDWLYTGRAFVINTLMLNAGWMSVQREDIGDQTYWRVFIRAHDQDGSHGAPIKDPPWDLNTRYQLDPQAYEAGGSYAPVPSGYWIDLTSLAEAYGWHRLAALPGWRTYYTGARFSEFAYTEGLDWYSAMLQLYPADALITATPLLPPTRTPTRTPRPTDTPYPTLTPRDTRTPTVTFTPSVSPTPLPPSQTPAPTSTPPTVIPTFPSPTP